MHGWPEFWYAWRMVMPALARSFRVVAVDQRGMGLSDKPATGYDTGTQAADLVALMEALGHPRFAVVGHDTGFTISYALAADHPERVTRAAMLEFPGLPGAAPSPPVFVPGPVNDWLWHLPFNRLERLSEQLVSGREDILFGWEFEAAAKKLPAEAIDYYVRALAQPESLRGSFGWYRALDTTNRPRRETQDSATVHAGPRNRRRGELRRARRPGDAAGRPGRAECGHPRHGSLPRRAVPR